MRKINFEVSFFKRVKKTDSCWEWIGCKNDGGYGTFHKRNAPFKTQKAHRISYQLLVGPIPYGLSMDHLCRNRWCVNPNHLEPVTHKINVARGLGNGSKTHCPRGHAYDEKNTRKRIKRGYWYRSCKKCEHILYRERCHREKLLTVSTILPIV